MRPTARWGAVAALLLGLLAPTGAAVPTTLYAHLAGFQDFPLNTQEPDPRYAMDERGAIGPTMACVPRTPATDFSTDLHTLYGYPSPAFVEYDSSETGRPRVHPERGLMQDVVLDATPMVLHWYWSQAMKGAADPTPAPDVVVHATLRAGDAISVDDQAYNTGAILAEGESAPALLAGPFSQGVETAQVDGRTVYHFVVPLKAESPVIPRAAGFNLRVSTYVKTDACPEGKAMPSDVDLHSSPGHRPRLELGVADPFNLTWGPPTADKANGTVDIPFLAFSPWGEYDVADLNVTVDGPAPLKVEVQALESHLHCHCYGLAQQRTLVVGTEGAPRGQYTAHVRLTNLQGANQTWDLPFSVGTEQALPGPAPFGLVLVLAAVAFVLRRRA